MKIFRVILALAAMSASAYGQEGKDSSPVFPAPVPFDMVALKTGWRERIAGIRKSGRLPIIDIESSGDPSAIDMADLARRMDGSGIALMALSSERPPDRPGLDLIREDPVRRVVSDDPSRFIPVTPGGGLPPWPQEPEKYLSGILDQARLLHYPLLGEFEFRHYPSVRHIRHAQQGRDVTVPIDGKAGDLLFSFSEKNGMPFLIHYEIEDRLLPPLENMLKKHPGAKVVWCHLGHIRYGKRSTMYGPRYVRRLIAAHPNLHFDLAVADPEAIYPTSGERYSRIWEPKTGRMDAGWRQVIIDHPWRFHSALDLGGDRMDELEKRSGRQRRLLDELPPQTREIVAYKAAWRLLFDEDY